MKRLESSVVIKGTKHGITVVLNESASYENLKQQIRDKFIASSKFFGNAAMALGFEGRNLTFEQQKEIADIISDVSQLNIVCLVDDDKEREIRYEEAVKKALESQLAKIKEKTLASNNKEHIKRRTVLQRYTSLRSSI